LCRIFIFVFFEDARKIKKQFSKSSIKTFHHTNHANRRTSLLQLDFEKNNFSITMKNIVRNVNDKEGNRMKAKDTIISDTVIFFGELIPDKNKV
jgi:hypothetical protein